MSKRAPSELDTGESLRCGRCADLLPDETLTFCPSCGVPFSQVQPTTTYHLVSTHRVGRMRTMEQYRTWALASFFFLGFWFAYGMISVAKDQIAVGTLKARIRPIEFYIKDFKELPHLDDVTKREAVLTAQQAFEDHFGLALKDVSIHEDTWPPLLNEMFEEARRKIQDTNSVGVTAFLDLPLSKLSFWEQKVFRALTLNWQRNPEAPLQVVITNLPVLVDHNENTSVETRHLSGSGLVSGLGHPGLVLVSTYRMNNDERAFDADRPITDGPGEKSRFLGEYLIAHELGHALLGLGDYVTPPEFYPQRSPAKAQLLKLSKMTKGSPTHSPVKSSVETSRQPASFLQEGEISQCLMHTDRGGGFAAWESLKKRTLGLPTSCTSYDSITRAFDLRLQSIALLKSGERESAEKAHAEASKLVNYQTQEWVKQEWTNEHKLFLSVFQRWWQAVFMVQSKND